jgi:hypothetical protein
MKRQHSFLLVLTVLLFLLAAPAWAQEPTAIPTELVTLDVVATTEAGEAVYGIILPTVSATLESTPPPGSDVTTTANTMNILLLLVVVLVVALVALVFIVLRNRSASGDETATRWLALLEAGRNSVFPPGPTAAWIARQEEAAEKTVETILDDAMIALIKAGYQVIAPPAPKPLPKEGAGAGPANTQPFPPAAG